ncbi:MAG: flavin reductase family protein [Chloroflexota bacterium]
MEKVKLGAGNFLYPLPTTIVGAMVGGKPNYLTVAYCGIVQNRPPMLSIALGKTHHTNRGIKEQKTFSVNIPSESMAEITDYIGINSGKTVDKSNLFETFYGTLKTAPMVRECAVNLECRLVQVLELGDTNEVFIGKIVEAHTEARYLTNGLLDLGKIKPLIFSRHDNSYWKVGERLGPAWSIGKNFKPR